MVLVCVYYCPHCGLYHLDLAVEFINAVPYHRTSTGALHQVQKSQPMTVH